VKFAQNLLFPLHLRESLFLCLNIGSKRLFLGRLRQMFPLRFRPKVSALKLGDDVGGFAEGGTT
jgi:hypothetical protein